MKMDLASFYGSGSGLSLDSVVGPAGYDLGVRLDDPQAAASAGAVLEAAGQQLAGTGSGLVRLDA